MLLNENDLKRIRFVTALAVQNQIAVADFCLPADPQYKCHE